ncbi:serine aminopeptidase domain-containing protein [Cellulomonas bogoriensis]|uniref:Peptidase S9 n=1 Tax=Cellulomonas bogoriensis 69B4 = DSM 16987 TaxID=1386082 RepID=A0A0A0BZJ8_9CELL|nr:alpha/beta fold hydrolase [Cellulomonas bogoriensis]KGM13365.1 peptidase S9 [Cellulomonas bogoriensis 69B4 = DSM 16987]
MRRTRAGATWVAAALALLAACGAQDPAPSQTLPSAPEAEPEPPAPPTVEPEPGEGEYRAGLPAAVEIPPDRTDPAALVVLVPGGGWRSADPVGLAPLADHLVGEGYAVATITYRTGRTGDVFPTPVDDVACAVAYASAQVPGVDVVVLGHSAGAHLASVAALDPVRSDRCPHRRVRVDGVVGLAGPYDVSATWGLAEVLFGVPADQAPEAWEQGNPLTLVERRPDLPFLLVHGEADQVVPVSFTTDFADALRGARHEVAVELLPDVDHAQVLSPDVVGDVVVGWLARVAAQA